MPKSSRTVNPLHFEDLEPHRFEDMVRQLAYDFRTWHSIEATGRLGADEGVDIRAIERVPTENTSVDTDEEESQPSYEERAWMIQCKREKTVGPTKITEIIAAAIGEEIPIPYGFIIAVACDVSHKTREVFRLEANRLGIEEFFLWGRSDLEDMLFLPKNDHLLFAYFGLSLQVRRRSEKAAFNARLVVKRKLVSVFKSLHGPFHDPVLLRDSAATEYPRPSSSVIFGENDKWRYFRFAGHLRPDYMTVIAQELWAWAKFDEREWDIISKFDLGWPREPAVRFLPEGFPHRSEEEETARRYWLTKVPKTEQARYRLYGFIHYDRILIIDDIGDNYHEPPHVIVDCRTGRLGFFDDVRAIIETDDRRSSKRLFADEAKRQALFPKVLPTVTDEEFYAAIAYKP
jgi:hypothetical protein